MCKDVDGDVSVRMSLTVPTDDVAPDQVEIRNSTQIHSYTHAHTHAHTQAHKLTSSHTRTLLFSHTHTHCTMDEVSELHQKSVCGEVHKHCRLTLSFRWGSP